MHIFTFLVSYMLSFKNQQTVFEGKSKINIFTSGITLFCESIPFRIDHITHLFSSAPMMDSNRMLIKSEYKVQNILML